MNRLSNLINYRVFNKSRKNNVILFHGLFANSGYWLPYLNSFKNYRIIVFDFNYNNLFLEEYDNFIKLLFENFDKLNINSETDFLISHSLGTVIGKVISNKFDLKSYEICPIYFAKRNSINDFLLDVRKKTKLKLEHLKRTHSTINFFLKKNLYKIKNLESRSNFFIPSKDRYYNYRLDDCNLFYFSGDHFDIEDALNIINNIRSNE